MLNKKIINVNQINIDLQSQAFAAYVTNLVLCLLSLQMNKQFWRKPSVFPICYGTVS